LLLAASMLTTACGARWSSSQRAAVLRSRGDGPAAANGAASGPGVTSASGQPVVGGESAGSSATTPAAGDATTPGQRVADGATGVPGPRPCTAPSSAPGVTSAAINVGAIATISGPVPGLAQSSQAGASAYVAYRNSVGGVCGRRIVLKSADDGFEQTRFRAIIQDMAKSTFGLISTFAGGDGGGVDIATNAHLPVTASALSDQFQDAPTVFDINPPPKDPHAPIAKYKYLYEHGVRTAAIGTIAQAASLAQMNLQQAQLEASGIKVVLRQELPLSTLSFDAPARAVANSKADYFLWLAAGSLNSNMAKSIKDTGYKLKYFDVLTAYGSSFIDMAGSASDGVISGSRALPSEDGGSNRELDTFLSWMARTAPGIAPDPFAVDAWASSKAFFDNLEALHGPITRDGLIAQLKTVTNYDAGGMYGPINLGQKVSNSWYVLMQVVGRKWQRLAPAQGFIC
jgi:ABC-type branched-subunit amino acid transport system substrate-binding protein